MLPDCGDVSIISTNEFMVKTYAVKKSRRGRGLWNRISRRGLLLCLRQCEREERKERLLKPQRRIGR